MTMLREATAQNRALGPQIDAALNLNLQAEAFVACGEAAEARHTLEQALMLTRDSIVLVNFSLAFATLAVDRGDIETEARVVAGAEALNERLAGFSTEWEAEHRRRLQQTFRASLDAQRLAGL